MSKIKPVFAWLSLAVGLMMLAAVLLTGGAALSQMDAAAWSSDLIQGDFYYTQGFQRAVQRTLRLMYDPFGSVNDVMLYSTVYNTTKVELPDGGMPLNVGPLQEIGDFNGFIYYSGNESFSKYVYTNIAVEIAAEGFDALRQKLLDEASNYRFILIQDGESVTLLRNGLERVEPGYDPRTFVSVEKGYPLSTVKLLLAVGWKGNEDLSGMSGSIGTAYYTWSVSRVVQPILAGALVASLALITLGLAAGKRRRLFVEGVLHFTGRIWMEWKIALTAGFCILITVVFSWMTNSINYGWSFGLWSVLLLLLGVMGLWALWFLFLDSVKNGGRAWKHNSIAMVLRIYRRHEQRQPMQKMLIRRLWVFAAAESVLIFLTCWCLPFLMNGHTLNILPMLMFITVGVGLFIAYVRRYRIWVDALAVVQGQAAALRAGDFWERAPGGPMLPEDHELYAMSEDLRHVREGFSVALQERMKAERMKAELITNVSHDLKTPLTSIVSYIDLLAGLSLAPEKANEYVEVLNRKARRLDRLIQDLFEISRAQSGSLPVERRRIDLAAQVRQSLAELEERIVESKLDFRVSLPEEQVFVEADGQKLYRVLENLVVNALKYAMPGTRVYVNLCTNEAEALLELKNVASYAMEFDPEEIINRFVRADTSRTGEGSGLGLAIARSYVESSGGSFRIQTDGDLFKALIRFPLAP